MLEIKNLQSSINEKNVLKGLNLNVNPGEIHAIMGPNGSGKSTLASVISGNEDHEVINGDIRFMGESILDYSPEDRARAGIFLSFQYPVEIPGVSVSNFIKTSVNEIRKSRGLPQIKANELLKAMNKSEFYLSSFGQDENNELYLIDYSGDVYSITH